MPRSRSSLLRWGLLGLLVAVAPLGCDELNPDYDPSGGPICEAGDRQCDGAWTQVCQSEAVGWVDERECWLETSCVSGACLPEEPTASCEHEVDCSDGDVCTALVDPQSPGRLATFCIVPPNPTGRPSGQVCDTHDECQSGWCYRSICFEACTETSQCKNALHECGLLEVTVDGVRRSVGGCVPPAS